MDSDGQSADNPQGCVWIAFHAALLISLWWAFVWAFPFLVILYQLHHSEEYVATQFTVESVHYSAGGHTEVGGAVWWAEGIIASDQSRQRCSLTSRVAHVRSTDELRQAIPIGTILKVRYNGRLTDMLVQNASPRVIIDESGNVFSEMRWNAVRILARALIPLVVFSVLVHRVRRAAGSGPLFPWRTQTRNATEPGVGADSR